MFDIPLPLLAGQILLGIINGAFYAVLSVGLSVIFGMLRVINFAHGALYMLGAFVAWYLMDALGVGYWWSILLAPAVVFVIAVVIERFFLSRLYNVDHVYALLMTFGLSLVIEGAVRYFYGSGNRAYPVPEELSGVVRIGFMVIPNYRLFVVAMAVAICLGVWFFIDRTRLGSFLRASAEKPGLSEVFGINVRRLMTLTFGAAAALAALAGVLAAPIYQVGPSMGHSFIIVAFAIVVIGGVGSIMGTVAASFLLGILEGLTKVFYPQAASVIIFVVMALILFVRPAGLFGRPPSQAHAGAAAAPAAAAWPLPPQAVALGSILLLAVAPFLFSPIILMKVICFAMLAASFNMLFGMLGMLSFGHAAFFGGGAYMAAWAILEWNVNPEVALLLAASFSVMLGALFGAIVIRRSDVYFAMSTLALAQIFYFLCVRAPLTRGEDGLQGVARGKLFGVIDLSSDTTLYFSVATAFFLVMLAIWRLTRSPFGNILRAIHDNELRVDSLGYSPVLYKYAAFVISAGIAGFAGGMKAIVFQYATLADVGWAISGDAILMTLIGGVGTLLGPVVGAGVLVTVQFVSATTGFPVSIIVGTLFVGCVLLFRQGIVGSLGTMLGSRRRAGADAKAGAVVPSHRVGS